MSYWGQRQKDQETNILNDVSFDCGRQLQKEYQRLAVKTKAQVEDLFLEIQAAQADGSILVSDLYRYQRYYDLLNDLNRNLSSLGLQEIKILNASMEQLYKQVATLDNSFAFGYNEEMARKAIDKIWCADGKHWKDRVWINKQLLQQDIQEGLIDCVSRGVSTRDIIQRLNDDFGSGFYKAKRIVDTELNYLYNQCCLDKYAQAGITQYEFLANQADDGVCSDLNGKIFPISQAQVGVNLPPIHPNCKCTILAVL